MFNELSSAEIDGQQVELLPDRTVMSAFSTPGGFHGLFDFGGDGNDGGDANGGDGGDGGDGGSGNAVAGNVNGSLIGGQENSAGNGGDGGDGGDGGIGGDGGGNAD